MWELFQYTILILPTVYFGYRYHLDFEGVHKVKKYPALTKFAFLTFLAYMSLFLILGADAIETHVATTGKYQHTYSYLFPGIGFGLAMFPTEEWEVSSNTVSAIGWFILIALCVNAIVRV